MRRIIHAGILLPHHALKLAGRLTSAVTMSLDRVGRAFVKPFYAQAYDPYQRISAMLERACVWWIEYLSFRPPHTFRVECCRPLIWMWTDASGESRLLGAVCLKIVGGMSSWFYTALNTPHAIWDQLIDRGDHQIGYQEFLAVLLGYASFRLNDVLMFAFIDNQGVLRSILKGSSRHPEMNMGVGKFWLDMAQFQIACYVGRVESSANIADGPSRNEFELLTALSAVYVPPKLPEWAWQVWDWPEC